MSYLKQEFMDHLHNKNYASPGSYCNALDNIEKFFTVDIDVEFDKDQCSALHTRILEMKKTPEVIGKNEHDVRTYASRLKKYIEFRQGESSTKFGWVNFYKEFADALLEYKDNRTTLISKIKDVYKNINIPLPKLDNNDVVDIDPFTVFGLFNKGISDANRKKIIKGLADAFDVEAELPGSFNGVPVLNNLKATFYHFIGYRKDEDISNLWKVFEAAINYADNKTEENKSIFIKYYDKAIKQDGIRWNLSIGLFWIRPETFLSLDSVSRAYLPEFNPPVGGVFCPRELPNGEKYLRCIEELSKTFAHDSTMAKSFYELSLKAFEYDNIKNKADLDKNQINHAWFVGANINNIDMTSSFIEEGRWENGWQDQFIDNVNEIKVGDKIAIKCSYTKKNVPFETNGEYVSVMGIKAIGTVTKNHMDGHNIDVNWEKTYTPTKEWYFFTMRNTIWHVVRNSDDWMYGALIDFTFDEQEQDYAKFLSHPYWSERYTYNEDSDEIAVENTNVSNPIYTKEDFLKDVYISEEKYETCVSRLKHKKNLILQGAPGVGKTFAARRLAWSIMGVKDSNRIELVQFHQSYSYEDFIMGYKPIDNGFRLEKGIFYEFCLKAKDDPDKDYFFIIDEINRGNMSKIFGELLMLIESDYRENEIKLAYSKKPFSVPQNLYIIGMMNTADRSLAMIDYALRRRFSFIEMKPGFDSQGFINYQNGITNDKFIKLINKIKELNRAIENDSSLGKGFCIGHSYFCKLDTDISDSELKEIVEYDIIPMLEEYWFDDEATVQRWTNDLRGVFNG